MNTQIKLFIEEQCDISPSFKVLSSVLFNQYQEWVFRKYRPLNRRTFKHTLEELGFFVKRTNAGNVFIGIKIKPNL